MDGLSLSITPLYAGILALIYVGLSVNVIRGRRAKSIGLGTGDDPDMLTRVRIHGNFAEFVPICLVLMVVLELGGSSAVFLNGVGISLVLGRLAHAYGLTKSPGVTPGRVIGVVTVFVVLVGGGVRAILLGLGI
jgi:uncharacterized membrane protein YecN with MAPEG domain